jgi:ubiquinone/menaquinone biosynthesis C-methylase UbiE
MSEPVARRTLTREEARRVYDRIGARQDTQAFYEDHAVGRAVRHAGFADARSVFEFGFGTGRFAERLLSQELPQEARWRGVDVSPEMVRLARRRLERFGARAEVVQSDGSPPVDEPAGAYDRFVSNYVMDLLSEEDIRGVLDQAERMLRPGGRLCLVSLTTGCSTASRAVIGIWSRVHGLAPKLVGGCRPLELRPRLVESAWNVLYHDRSATYGLPSEVIVAERRGEPPSDS